ncbi:MAG: KR domain-containing protein [Rhodospirillaceae bacterium]|nr:KR domain-containing protein [Rhodospirillaceae bacterium]
MLAAPESWADGVAAARALRSETGELFVFDLSDLGGPPSDRDRLPLGRIAFLQTLLRDRPDGLRLFHATHGLGEGAEPPSLRGAAMAALMRMLPAEHPGLVARTVDADTAPENIEAWRELLVGEAARTAEPDSEIRYRDGERLRPGLRASLLAPSEGLAPFVVPDGTYVVTGGTRGIGLALAQALVAAGVRRLALIGRTVLPPESEWVGLLADERGDPALRAKLAPLAALRDAGVKIALHGGALTDGDALAAFLARVRTSLGPIAGVIHAAGLIGGERPRFLDKLTDDFAAVAEPKVEGLDTLLDTLAGDSPGFVLLCSSIASAVPRMAAGMSDYALANGYMDALATQRAAGGGATQWLSLQWVGWGDTGMHTRFDESIERMVRDGLGAVGLDFCDSETGVTLFAGALSEGLSGAFVAAPVLGARLEASLSGLLSVPPGPAVALNDETDPDLDSLSDQDLDRLLAAYQPQAPVAAEAGGADDGMASICAILAEVLELEAGEFGPDTPFRDVGLDSIAALRVAQRLEEETGEAVTPRMLLDHPTARDLAAVLWPGVMEAAQ